MSNFDVCMILLGAIEHDSRVIREAVSLTTRGCKVLVVEIQATGAAASRTKQPFDITTIAAPAWLNRIESSSILHLTAAFWRAARYLRRVDARVYHAHDFTGLIAVALAGLLNRTIVYDSHELFFERSGGRTRLYRPLKLIEPWLAAQAAGVITVSDAIADFMNERWRIPRPTVVRNVVDIRSPAEPAQLYPTHGRRVIVHSGRIAHSRHLTELIASLAYLPDERLVVLMGEGQRHVREDIVRQAAALGKHDNVMLLPAVPVQAVSATLAQADVGVALLPTSRLSYRYSLPNKVFEYIAAGLPVVVSGGVELAELTQRYQIGAVCDETDPHSIAEAIEEVLDPGNYSRLKENVREARRVLNWEVEEKKLWNLYDAVYPPTPVRVEHA